MRKAAPRGDRHGETEEDGEIPLLLFKRDTFKAVIMTQKECNYFPGAPGGSECLLIVIGDNLMDHRYK